MRYILFLIMLLTGCATNGFYYVQSETLNSVMVVECKTVAYGHSEDVHDSKNRQKCRKFFMTPDQLAGWKSLQKSIKDRGLPDGIVVGD